ncbi:histone deacetylase superfamily protein [Oceanimonas sp. GK1]|uniref:class II histone deacetylase n=1 Tax=Oceanimonas sp. (strain GK1 / IBRC-M 10197) TaxID=511062 RepID=UPI0002494AE6|nr:class II histone deacetylase [Oceanimonas sp. GK1]AEX99797.1 histone deacetylase superfamily protein [Oceanimonas sp. GK1]
MKRTGFAFHEHCLWHDAGPCSVFDRPGGFVQPAAAAEHPETKRRLRNLLAVSGLLEQLTPVNAAPAAREDLLRFHTERYIDELSVMSEQGFGDAGQYAPFRQDAFPIACRSAGLAMATVAAVLNGEVDNGYCLSRPPGHHAEADRGMGFCLLGNIPIAIRAAQAQGLVRRVAVIDWDVHHGNGTQQAFYEDAEVLTLSLHHDNNYPVGSGSAEERGSGAGFGYNLNVPLPAGSGIGTYLAAMDQLVIPALDRFKPELIVVACGFDASAMDPLGCMLLNADAFGQLTANVMAAADRLCRGRLVMVHEGGYSEGYVPFCGHRVIETLSQSDIHVPDPAGGDIARWGQQELQPHQAALLESLVPLLTDIHA